MNTRRKAADPALLTIACMLFALGLLPPAHADITTDLVASYSFNNHTYDISGQANHGVAQGPLLFAPDRFGNPNAAAEFDGLSSWVFVPQSASLNTPTTEVTQAAWVRSHGVSLVGHGFNPILMKSDTGENAFMYRMITSPAGYGAAFNNWTTHVTSSASQTMNEWYHLATVFDGTTLHCYLNGTLTGALPLSLTITQDTRDLAIGADIPGILEIFNGRMDDVRIYARALSATDIAELYGAATDAPFVQDAAHKNTLGASYPNPALGATRVSFVLENPQHVELRVHDIAGRIVRSLLTGLQSSGTHAVVWDGRDNSGIPTAAGTYFLQLETEGDRSSSRVTRIR